MTRLHFEWRFYEMCLSYRAAETSVFHHSSKNTIAVYGESCFKFCLWISFVQYNILVPKPIEHYYKWSCIILLMFLLNCEGSCKTQNQKHTNEMCVKDHTQTLNYWALYVYFLIKWEVLLSDAWFKLDFVLWHVCTTRPRPESRFKSFLSLQLWELIWPLGANRGPFG